MVQKRGGNDQVWMDPVRDPAIHVKLDEELKSSRASGGLGCKPSLDALSVSFRLKFNKAGMDSSGIRGTKADLTLASQ